MSPRTHAGGVLAVVLGGALSGFGCQSSGYDPQSPPVTGSATQSTLLAQGTFEQLPSSQGGKAHVISATKVVVFTSTVSGSLDAAVSWTHHDDVVTVAFYPSGCTAAHFGTGQCASLAQETSQTGSLSQHVVLYGGQPGDYVLGIQNLGPHAETGAFQVVLTN